MTDSAVIAFLAGLGLGFVIGVPCGLWLGRTIGYDCQGWKIALAVALVVAVSSAGFSGWYFWERGELPTLAKMTKPLSAEDVSTVRNSFSTGGMMASVFLVCLAMAFRQGREQRCKDDELLELRHKAKPMWFEFWRRV